MGYSNVDSAIRVPPSHRRGRHLREHAASNVRENLRQSRNFSGVKGARLAWIHDGLPIAQTCATGSLNDGAHCERANRRTAGGGGQAPSRSGRRPACVERPIPLSCWRRCPESAGDLRTASTTSSGSRRWRISKRRPMTAAWRRSPALEKSDWLAFGIHWHTASDASASRLPVLPRRHRCPNSWMWTVNTGTRRPPVNFA